MAESTSPKRDAMQPASGKMLKDDDTVLDVSEIIANVIDSEGRLKVTNVT